MASKPKAALKTTSKTIAKAIDENLSAKDLQEKTDFMENHVGHAKPLLADAVIKQIGGWSVFSLYAHDVTDCGIDFGFKGFSKDNDCKAFFNEHKKLLKDFYKPMTAKAKKAAEEAASEQAALRPQPFSDDEIAEAFGTKAKIVVVEEDIPLLVSDDYDDVDVEVKKVVHVKQDVEITVWLTRNAGQHIADAYTYLHSDRYDADIVEEKAVVEDLNDDFYDESLFDERNDSTDDDQATIDDNEQLLTSVGVNDGHTRS